MSAQPIKKPIACPAFSPAQPINNPSRVPAYQNSQEVVGFCDFLVK